MSRPVNSKTVTSLSVGRARKMLKEMQQYPFILFIFTDGELKAYGSDLKPEEMELVSDLLDDLA